MKILIILITLPFLVLVAGLIWAHTAKTPTLGIQNGKLSDISTKPNCVSTQYGTTEQKMEPIKYTGTQDEAQKKLLSIIGDDARTKIQEQKSGYVWAVYHSALFGFPDDVEFLFNDKEKVIHFRAAARLGHSDMGINKKRMLCISKLFEHSY